ncbi:hypothetical protein MTP99_002246 [Tenebrio molitor]|nr:hypothetical protein MTP99_002246 [Tenebrio molitor]
MSPTSESIKSCHSPNNNKISLRRLPTYLRRYPRDDIRDNNTPGRRDRHSFVNAVCAYVVHGNRHDIRHLENGHVLSDPSAVHSLGVFGERRPHGPELGYQYHGEQGPKLGCPKTPED